MTKYLLPGFLFLLPGCFEMAAGAPSPTEPPADDSGSDDSGGTDDTGDSGDTDDTGDSGDDSGSDDSGDTDDTGDSGDDSGSDDTGSDDSGSDSGDDSGSDDSGSTLSCGSLDYEAPSDWAAWDIMCEPQSDGSLKVNACDSWDCTLGDGSKYALYLNSTETTCLQQGTFYDEDGDEISISTEMWDWDWDDDGDVDMRGCDGYAYGDSAPPPSMLTRRSIRHLTSADVPDSMSWWYSR